MNDNVRSFGLSPSPDGRFLITTGMGFEDELVESHGFFARLSLSNGTVEWTAQLISNAANSERDRGTNAVVVGDLVYAVGSCAMQCFTRSPNGDMRTLSTGYGREDAVLVVFNATNGRVLTSLAMGSPGDDYFSAIVALEELGLVVCGGSSRGQISYRSQVVFPVTDDSLGESDMFLAALDTATWDLVWVRADGGVFSDVISDLVTYTDPLGTPHVYAVGYFEDSGRVETLAVKPDGRPPVPPSKGQPFTGLYQTLESRGLVDVLLLSLSAADGNLTSAQSVGGSGYDVGYSATFGPGQPRPQRGPGTVFITSVLQGGADLTPGSGAGGSSSSSSQSERSHLAASPAVCAIADSPSGLSQGVLFGGEFDSAAPCTPRILRDSLRCPNSTNCRWGDIHVDIAVPCAGSSPITEIEILVGWNKCLVESLRLPVETSPFGRVFRGITFPSPKRDLPLYVYARAVNTDGITGPLSTPLTLSELAVQRYARVLNSAGSRSGAVALAVATVANVSAAGGAFYGTLTSPVSSGQDAALPFCDPFTPDNLHGFLTLENVEAMLHSPVAVPGAVSGVCVSSAGDSRVTSIVPYEDPTVALNSPRRGRFHFGGFFTGYTTFTRAYPNSTVPFAAGSFVFSSNSSHGRQMYVAEVDARSGELLRVVTGGAGGHKRNGVYDMARVTPAVGCQVLVCGILSGKQPPTLAGTLMPMPAGWPAGQPLGKDGAGFVALLSPDWGGLTWSLLIANINATSLAASGQLVAVAGSFLATDAAQADADFGEGMVIRGGGELTSFVALLDLATGRPRWVAAVSFASHGSYLADLEMTSNLVVLVGSVAGGSLNVTDTTGAAVRGVLPPFGASASGKDAFALALNLTVPERPFLAWQLYLGATTIAEQGCTAIAVEGSSIFVTGTFQAQLLIRGGDSPRTLTSRGSRDCFLLELDAADGRIVWATRSGGVGGDMPRDIVSSSWGLLYGGQFYGRASFSFRDGVELHGSVKGAAFVASFPRTPALSPHPVSGEVIYPFLTTDATSDSSFPREGWIVEFRPPSTGPSPVSYRVHAAFLLSLVDAGLAAPGLFPSSPGTLSVLTDYGLALPCPVAVTGTVDMQGIGGDVEILMLTRERLALQDGSAYLVFVSGINEIGESNLQAVEYLLTCPSGWGYEESGVALTQSTCSPCPSGTFKPPRSPHLFLSGCERCPQGDRMTSTEGSSAASNCTCAPGFEPPACIYCAPGYYAEQSNPVLNTRCKHCPLPATIFGLWIFDIVFLTVAIFLLTAFDFLAPISVLACITIAQSASVIAGYRTPLDRMFLGLLSTHNDCVLRTQPFLESAVALVIVPLLILFSFTLLTIATGYLRRAFFFFRDGFAAARKGRKGRAITAPAPVPGASAAGDPFTLGAGRTVGLASPLLGELSSSDAGSETQLEEIEQPLLGVISGDAPSFPGRNGGADMGGTTGGTMVGAMGRAGNEGEVRSEDGDRRNGSETSEAPPPMVEVTTLVPREPGRGDFGIWFSWVRSGQCLHRVLGGWATLFVVPTLCVAFSPLTCTPEPADPASAAPGVYKVLSVPQITCYEREWVLYFALTAILGLALAFGYFCILVRVLVSMQRCPSCSALLTRHLRGHVASQDLLVKLAGQAGLDASGLFLATHLTFLGLLILALSVTAGRRDAMTPQLVVALLIACLYVLLFFAWPAISRFRLRFLLAAQMTVLIALAIVPQLMLRAEAAQTTMFGLASLVLFTYPAAVVLFRVFKLFRAIRNGVAFHRREAAASDYLFSLPESLTHTLTSSTHIPGSLTCTIDVRNRDEVKKYDRDVAHIVAVVDAELARLPPSLPHDVCLPTFVPTRIVVVYNPVLERAFRDRYLVLSNAARKTLVRPWPKSRAVDRARVSTVFSDLLDRRVWSAQPDPGENPPGLDLVWHGCLGGVDSLYSICKLGFINLARLNTGFYGRGAYFTHYSQYALWYATGGGALRPASGEQALLLSWVLLGQYYPVLQRMDRPARVGPDGSVIPEDPERIYHGGYNYKQPFDFDFV